MLNRKVTKSIFVLFVMLISTFSTINLQTVNAVDITTNYSAIFYVTEQKGDAYYLSGYQFRNNSSLAYLKDSTYDTYSGFRFTTVTIPDNATIDHAYLCLYSSDGIDNFDYMVTINGENVDSGNDFDVSTDLTNADLTISHTSWNMKDLEGNTWRNSTDIKTSIQEIVNRVGWSSGNNVSLILLSAVSANGFRSFRTWDYNVGHTYRPKLIVEYHLTTPVSNSNPWDYISDFNDNWNLINETNGYTWWEIWNGTSTGEVWSYRSAQPVSIFSQGDLTSSAIGGGASYFDRYGLTSYTMFNFDGRMWITNENATGIHLFSSSDGDNWSYESHLAVVSTGYSIFFDGNNLLHFVYVKTSNQHLYYNTYNPDTKVLGSEYDLYNMGVSSYPIGLYFDGNDIYTGYTDATNIYMFKKTGVSWGSRVTVDGGYSSPTNQVQALFIDDSGIHTYIIWNNNPHWIGNLIEPNLSVGTPEVLNCAIFGEGRIAYRPSDKEVRFFLPVSDGTNPYQAPYDDYDILSLTRDYVSKTWSAKSEIIHDISGQGFYAYYNSAWEIGKYCIGFNDKINSDLIRVYTGDDVSWSQQDTFEYSWSGIDGILMGNGVTAGIHQFVLLDPEGNPVTSIPDFPPTPILLNTTIDDWLFKGEVYEFKATVQNTNEAEFNLTDGYHTMIFYYNNITTPITHKVYTLNADGTLINEDVIGGISTTHVLAPSNITFLTWKFILGINVIDILNTTISYNLVNWNTTSLISVSISGLTNSTVNIYNLGGKAEYQYAGDGQHILGGHPFELKATNSSLVSGGSYAESCIIYRRLQYIHLLAELDMDNEVESVEHFEPLVNIGYAEFGIDYKLEGNESDAWIEGWKCRIYAQEINVGTYGVGNDMAYVKMYVFWYNRGDFVGGNEFYSYHMGYDKSPHFPTDRRSFNFWVDLWFDKTNSSTVFGGRVNAYTYGYYEDGSAWWFNSAFRPMIGNVTSSMMLGNIVDSDGNIIQSKKISLVRVVSKVAKTASGMGGLGDDNTYRLRPYSTLEVNLATDRMEGIDTPPMIDTGYLDLGGYGIWGYLMDTIGNLGGGFFNLSKLILSSVDTILSWFGLPYGTFSSIISFLSILPSMMISLLFILYQVFTNVMLVIVSGSSLFIMTIVGWVSIMLSTINLISNFITIFIDLFRGGYGTGVDIWTTYAVASWLSLIMLLIPLMWFQRLARADHPLETLASDIELMKIFTHTMINFFDWLFDRVLYIAQIFLSLIR